MKLRDLGLRLIVPLSLISFFLPQSLHAATLTLNATVTVDERGFQPVSVTIARGGAVTWQNTGTTGHVVETGSAPLQINLGVDVGKSASWTFGLPGVYHYSSATDCAPDVTKALFACIDYTVVVLDEPPGSVLPAAQATPAPSPTPPATVSGSIAQPVIVSITDSGISPAGVTIPAGGSVNFVNHGSQVHTATSPAGTNAFDTGGLASGQSTTIAFAAPGTYSYTSSPDCLQGGNQQIFSCGPYAVTVTNGPAAPPSPTPTAVGQVTPANNTTVTIDDVKGFQPNVLTIKVGQVVTWVNKGNNVHAAVTDSGISPSFDSGGLGPGQSFSWEPISPGRYTYHSPPDAVYVTVAYCGCPMATPGAFSATIVVGS